MTYLADVDRDVLVLPLGQGEGVTCLADVDRDVLVLPLGQGEVLRQVGARLTVVDDLQLVVAMETAHLEGVAHAAHRLGDVSHPPVLEQVDHAPTRRRHLPGSWPRPRSRSKALQASVLGQSQTVFTVTVEVKLKC